MVCAGGSSKPITPPTAVAVAGAEAYEIEDTLSWSPRRAYEYLYDQVCSTVTNPKVVVGVSFDDDAAVPVLDCDVQLRNVSVLRVSVWYVCGPASQRKNDVETRFTGSLTSIPHHPETRQCTHIQAQLAAALRRRPSSYPRRRQGLAGSRRRRGHVRRRLLHRRWNRLGGRDGASHPIPQAAALGALARGRPAAHVFE